MIASFGVPQSPARLRLALATLMIVLLLPAALLVREAWRQVRWEGLHQQQSLARELVAGINRSLERVRSDEAAIAFDEYAFATSSAGTANVVQRSALSEFPVRGGLPGLLGRFQLGADGEFTTPLLPAGDPAAFGLSDAEYRARADREGVVFAVLQAEPVAGQAPLDQTAGDAVAVTGPGAAKLDEVMARRAAPMRDSDLQAAEPGVAAVEEAVAEATAAPPEQDAASSRRDRAIFDRLASNAPPPSAPAAESPERRKASGGLQSAEKERTFAEPALGDEVGEREDAASRAEPSSPAVRLDDARLLSIDAALDSLSFLLLDSDHFVLFRRQFRDGRRFLQGAALERTVFIDRVIARPFRDSAVSAASDLDVVWGATPLEAIAGRGASRRLGYDPTSGALAGELLHEERLIAPFDGLRLRFLARDVPPGPGGAVVLWTGGALLLLTLVGFHLLYRAGVRQLELGRQQQDFVSAVSHELRTPLTSIRMYSEMLRAGWADEARRREYYDYIHAESERLSRLVANVLQLSRMNRTGLDLAIEAHEVGELLESALPALRQVTGAGGFELHVACAEDAGRAQIAVDRDALLQVLLNLVDNAVKFGADADRRVVEFGAELDAGREMIFTVRDHGPGLPPGDPERLFELFYRPPRTSDQAPGTGIGLALVRSLVEAMGARVRGRRAAPGAIFELRFPLARPAERMDEDRSDAT